MNRRTTATVTTAVGVGLALVCAWFVGHRLSDDWPA
ncbi:MAG: hypothetical protein JWN29_174, partial [Acidimicrobiales bacterium]|nr:hypothetical protein [Acidimicrobiales bacterium]